MATPHQPAAEQWSSRAGFVFATLGAAVGLGNVWRFSYVAGENGGAAFLLVYALFVLLIGLPLLLAEFGIGRATQMESAAAFERLAREPALPGARSGAGGLVTLRAGAPGLNRRSRSQTGGLGSASVYLAIAGACNRTPSQSRGSQDDQLRVAVLTTRGGTLA